MTASFCIGREQLAGRSREHRLHVSGLAAGRGTFTHLASVGYLGAGPPICRPHPLALCCIHTKNTQFPRPPSTSNLAQLLQQPQSQVVNPPSSHTQGPCSCTQGPQTQLRYAHWLAACVGAHTCCSRAAVRCCQCVLSLLTTPLLTVWWLHADGPHCSSPAGGPVGHCCLTASTCRRDQAQHHEQ